MKNSTMYYLAFAAMALNYTAATALICGCNRKNDSPAKPDSRAASNESELVITIEDVPIVKEPQTNSPSQYPKRMIEGAVDAARHADELNAKQVRR